MFCLLFDTSYSPLPAPSSTLMDLNGLQVLFPKSKSKYLLSFALKKVLLLMKTFFLW